MDDQSEAQRKVGRREGGGGGGGGSYGDVGGNGDSGETEERGKVVDLLSSWELYWVCARGNSVSVPEIKAVREKAELTISSMLRNPADKAVTGSGPLSDVVMGVVCGERDI